MEPAQMGRSCSEVQRKWPATKDDLSRRQGAIQFGSGMFRPWTLPKIPLHCPAGPGLSDLSVKPASCIDHLELCVDRGNAVQTFGRYRDNNQYLYVICYHRIPSSDLVRQQIIFAK